MDHDAPEIEELNLCETLTCCRVLAVYLSRAAVRAAEATHRLADVLRPLMDDHMDPDD